MGKVLPGGLMGIPQLAQQHQGIILPEHEWRRVSVTTMVTPAWYRAYYIDGEYAKSRELYEKKLQKFYSVDQELDDPNNKITEPELDQLVAVYDSGRGKWVRGEVQRNYYVEMAASTGLTVFLLDYGTTLKNVQLIRKLPDDIKMQVKNETFWIILPKVLPRRSILHKQKIQYCKSLSYGENWPSSAKAEIQNWLNQGTYFYIKKKEEKKVVHYGDILFTTHDDPEKVWALSGFIRRAFPGLRNIMPRNENIGRSSRMSSKSSRISGKSSHISGKSSRISGKSSRISGKSSRISGKSSHISGKSSRMSSKSSRISGKSLTSGKPDMPGNAHTPGKSRKS